MKVIYSNKRTSLLLQGLNYRMEKIYCIVPCFYSIDLLTCLQWKNFFKETIFLWVGQVFFFFLQAKKIWERTAGGDERGERGRCLVPRLLVNKHSVDRHFYRGAFDRKVTAFSWLTICLTGFDQQTFQLKSIWVIEFSWLIFQPTDTWLTDIWLTDICTTDICPTDIWPTDI